MRLHGRLARVLGRDFAENALQIEAERDGLQLTGYAALPTYSRGSSVAQYLFVNGRPVQDKMLMGALRAAYFDFLSRDRHPAAALFIDCDPHLVDVNVHPAKSEVRFREPGVARGLIVSGLAPCAGRGRASGVSTVADATLGAMRPETPQVPRGLPDGPPVARRGRRPIRRRPRNSPGLPKPPAHGSSLVETDRRDGEALPLGAARAQVHENYIIAQTETGIVIVDQHAAHERLVYEKLKRQMAENGVAAQALLIPEIVEMSEGDAARLLDIADELARLGLTMEPFGGGAMAVRETPAILGEVNAGAMLRDILDELDDLGGQPDSAGADRGDPEPGGLPRLDPVGPPDAGRGDERAVARNGGDAAFRAVQPRAADLCRTEADRYREAVRTDMIEIGDAS